MRKNSVAMSVLQWYIFSSTTLDQAVIAAPHLIGVNSSVQCDAMFVTAVWYSRVRPIKKIQGRNANYRWRKRKMSQQRKRKRTFKPALTALTTAVTLAIANQA